MVDLALSNELFLKFHQIQINLIKTACKDSINDYNNCLVQFFDQSFNTGQLKSQSSKLIEFFIYPILTVLKRFQLNSDSNEILLKSCILILSKIQLNDFNIFIEILNLTSILLSNKKSSKSEEFVCTCFQLLEAIFNCEISSKFYKFSNLTSIGLLISLCLDTLIESNGLQVRLKALLAFQSLLNQQRERLYVILPSFLPGISIKLVQKFLLNQNLKLINHKAVCLVVDIFGQAISIVFNDQLLQPEVYKKLFDACDQSELNQKVKGLIVNRLECDQWVSQSAEKMFFLIEKMLQNLIITDNSNIQMSIVKFCASISTNCYFTLNKYLPKILKVLVTFAVSDCEQVSKLALKSIDILDDKETMGFENSENFILYNKFSILDSCFEEILIKLPRVMQTKSNAKSEINDEQRKTILKTLYGYLRLVGDSPNFGIKKFFLLNSKHVRHLIEALLSCVQFDFKNLNNFYEIDNCDDFMKKSKSLSNYAGLKTYLEDTTLYEQISQVCEYLGKSDSIRLLIDELLTRDFVCSENGFLKLEVMFIVDLLLTGLDKQKKCLCQQELTSIIGLILNNFLTDFTILNEKGLDEVEAVASSSISDKNKLIIQTCLTLEAIRLSSKLLDTSSYNFFLIDTLYFILENYLNNNLLIRVVSTQCLIELCTNIGYKNIQDLLSQNFDYIMNDLILKSTNQNSLLKSEIEVTDVDLNKQSSHVFVLCALLDISNSDIVPYLGRIFDEFFLSIQLNPYEIRLVLGVCRIMNYFAKSVQRWHPIKFNFIQEDKAQDDLINLDLKKVAQVRKKSDYSKSFRETIDEIDELRKQFSQTKIDDSNPEESKSVPEYVKLQTKCYELSTHLISHPCRQVRIQVINLVQELSINLAEHTNEFLPLVHKIWSPLCHRFSLDDLIVKAKLIKLLYDLSMLCSDFISSRFCKEFVPRLCVFMKEQAQISGRSTKEGSNIGDATYIYSQAFKLQCSILANLDKMCILFEIRDLELEKLIDSCVLVYLDNLQPKKLQHLAMEACKSCALIDADVVWLSLHYVLPFKKIMGDKQMTDIFKNLNNSSKIKTKYNFSLNQDILLSLLRLFNEI